MYSSYKCAEHYVCLSEKRGCCCCYSSKQSDNQCFQSSQIKCACYLGLEKAKPNSDIRLLEGDLFRLADQAIACINDHLDVGAGEHNDGAASDEVREIPNAVIAEAVNNAIAHRNYANVGSVQIEIYQDRIEIINPGRLHPSLTIQDLYHKHESYPPNTRIAHALYQVKYIEALGTGITDLLKRCKNAGLKRPLFEKFPGNFASQSGAVDTKRRNIRRMLRCLSSL